LIHFQGLKDWWMVIDECHQKGPDNPTTLIHGTQFWPLIIISIY
jgi:hypothetical protein